MRLARKFTLALVAGILLVNGVSAVVRIRREARLFQEDVAHDEKVLGRALSHAVDRVWHTRGAEDALQLIAQATERESRVQIRWVWLDAGPGEAHAAAAPPELLRGLAPGKPVVARLGDGGALTTYVMVETPEPRPGALEISDLLVEEQRYVRRSVVNILANVLALVSLTAAFAWILGATVIGRPVGLLVEQARRVGSGDLSGRLNLRGRDEIGELAREMDAMCDRLLEARDRLAAETRARIAAMEQLRHADRLTTVGVLAAGVAHELGTPINVVEAHAQLIREDDAAGSRAREGAVVIARQCRRMEAIVRQLLDFARRGRAASGRCDLLEVARETLRFVEPLARRHGVATRLDAAGEAAPAAIAADQLQQVLANVIINGIDAMRDGGTLAVRVTTTLAAPPGGVSEPGEHHCVSVEDSGVGMDSGTMTRIFEPFFTTKDVGEGTGLGLAVAYGIVQDHGGWMEVASEPRRGSRFSIYLPAAGRR